MNYTLELLVQIAHGVANHFGDSCEIAIHDLRKATETESSIVYIKNGEVTNRSIGDAPSGIVLEALKQNPDTVLDKLSYLTRTDDNRIMKSSTMYIRGEDRKIQYIFSLNYDITDLLTFENAIHSLTRTQDAEKGKTPAKITHSVSDLLDTLIEQSVDLVGKPVAAMTKADKVKAVRYLNDAGAFLITKSGDKVSNYFGISKFTLYSYMDEAKK